MYVHETLGNRRKSLQTTSLRKMSHSVVQPNFHCVSASFRTTDTVSFPLLAVSTNDPQTVCFYNRNASWSYNQIMTLLSGEKKFYCFVIIIDRRAIRAPVS